MKIRFSHENGLFVDDKDSVLLEAFAEIENESYQHMFENGWLPHFNGWYQCRSCRLKLGSISARRKRELKQVNISEPQNIDRYVENAGKFKNELVYFLAQKNYLFTMDDSLLGVVNFYDNVLFYSTMIYDRRLTTNSCGTLSYYYLIEKFVNDFDYMYISNYYPIFEYKKDLPGFEYWTGKEWIK
jgi:hypothetical protein